MKRILFAAVAALMFAAGSASAADLPRKAPVYKAPPQAYYNWTGFYTGSSIGGAWWDVEGTYVDYPSEHHNVSGSRAIYGSHVGAQYQWGNIVLGVEGTYNTFLNRDFERTSGGADCIAPFCDARVDRLWTVGGRLGYAWDRWMIYGTGGYANGSIQTRRVSSSGTILDDSGRVRHDGWFAGAGVEVFLTRFLWSDLILGA